MKIRVDKLDVLFSKFIRLRDKYCQRCGGSSGLQTSHFYGRAKQSIRFDPENSCLLCFGCHQYFHSHPLEHVEWFKDRLGEVGFDLLQARARIPGKVDKAAIELYLKEQIKRLEVDDGS